MYNFPYNLYNCTTLCSIVNPCTCLYKINASFEWLILLIDYNNSLESFKVQKRLKQKPWESLCLLHHWLQARLLLPCVANNAVYAYAKKPVILDFTVYNCANPLVYWLLIFNSRFIIYFIAVSLVKSPFEALLHRIYVLAYSDLA